MNKYSSKAIKTAATVGMSLAMVLSAVPAVGNATVAQAAAVCATSDVRKLSDLFATAGITKDSMTSITSEDEARLETTSVGATYYAKDTALSNGNVPAKGLKIVASNASDGEINLDDAKKLELEENGLYLAAGSTDVNGATTKVETSTANILLVANNYVVYRVAADNTVVKDDAKPGETKYQNLFSLITGDWKDDLETVANNCSNVTAEIADYLLKLENEIKVMFGNNYDGTTGFVATVKNLGKNVTPSDLEALYRFQASYENNLSTDQKKALRNTIADAEEYLEYDSTTSGYQKDLSKYVDGLIKEFEDFIEASKYTSIDEKTGEAITTSEIKKAIADIKKGPLYTRFRNEDSVKEVITSYEDLYDNIKEVEEAIDKKNDAYAEYTKGGSNSIKNKYNTKKIDEKIDTMKTAHFEIYKAFKESIVDVVFTMESKESVNRFIDKSTKSPFVTIFDLYTVLDNFDVKGELYKIYDDEDGTFGWDALEAHMNKVNDSLKALEDLSKYDAVTLSVNDKEALVKMDDAVYFLQTDGVDNLTSAQTRTVRDASRKVTELMEAYRKQFGSIDSTVNGWVNKGNGDWAYYENGNAVTKWVASGSDWYYVRGGVMLRNSWIASDSQGTKWYYVDDAGKMVSNTTVNGYTFNSYGVWVK